MMATFPVEFDPRPKEMLRTCENKMSVGGFIMIAQVYYGYFIHLFIILTKEGGLLSHILRIL